MISLWQHQKEDLTASWWLPAAAIHWEPRLGKSRLVIDTADRLLTANKIDACLVVAPNGVHLGWTRDQLPLYWERLDTLVVEWRSNRVGTKAFDRELMLALEYPGFVWLACNVEAVATPRLQRYLARFVKRRRCLLVVDEAQYVKNGRAQRTRALMRLAEHCPYRRTLTGTPTPQSPFDLWSQFYLLDPTVLGLRYVPFKQRYGVWRRRQFGNGPAFDELVEYKNLDDLARRIAPITFERKKAACLDLPERVFTKRYFELPVEHARVYRQLRDELLARLSTGEELAAPQALVNLLRLQQISRGHVTDQAGFPHDLGAPYPSVDSVLALLADHHGKAIVWCRFVRDAALLGEALTASHGKDAVAVCVGGTVPAERVVLRVRFRDDPGLRFWVGTIGTGGIGVDLGAASLMVFYSHGYDLGQRLQALERNYGDSQKAERVEVVDLVAADTVDEKVLQVLERKENLAARLSVAGLRELLT